MCFYMFSSGIIFAVFLNSTRCAILCNCTTQEDYSERIFNAAIIKHAICIKNMK